MEAAALYERLQLSLDRSVWYDTQHLTTRIIQKPEKTFLLVRTWALKTLLEQNTLPLAQLHDLAESAERMGNLRVHYEPRSFATWDELVIYMRSCGFPEIDQDVDTWNAKEDEEGLLDLYDEKPDEDILNLIFPEDQSWGP